jgi:hypothetical protein
MKSELVLALVSSVIAVLSLVGTFIIFNITRHRENYQNLLERISFYFSSEMLMAIRQVWGHYRKYGESNFLDKYIAIMIAENKNLDSTSISKRLIFQTGTLHYQRRLVSQFWRGLSILIKNNLVPRKAVYSWWSQNDVDIVGRILIPLENKLAEYHRVPQLSPKTDPLYFLLKIKNNFYK